MRVAFSPPLLPFPTHIPSLLILPLLPLSLHPSQIMQEIHDNGIQIYNGEIDEEDDSKEIKELRVQLLFPTTIHTHIYNVHHSITVASQHHLICKQ